MKFNYLDKLPVLVLGIEYYMDYDRGFDDAYLYTFKDKNPIDNSPLSPLFIAHQTAGIGCHQHYIQGLILKPKDQWIPIIERICDRYLGTNKGVSGVSLSGLNEYADYIKQFNKAQCNYSYKSFEEGIYPIDCDVKWLRESTDNVFSDDLDDFLVFESNLHKFCGSIGRWGVYILGENSD